ncbi:MAG: Asp-tRNA(Asn)/Glu-tRNA(Gln) amidotransferase subunit GatB [Planctomycetes bacterium]|nr:Asp-tRNA(Asn)/Glu-tRNA(Gln) amidotransferase subunit GatB [Planctomycetota bacterium]
MTFVTVIGLEVHVQLRTASKLFSPAPVGALGDPNTRVHFVDLGLPGVLPRLNRQAVLLAVRAALALAGTVQPTSRFARKNYFYPDLPKGYQISQYEEPFCVGGRVPLDAERHARLHRIHLEEDAGKLIHTDAGTLVDLNRAGVPLIEIVGEPDLRSPADAHAFLVHLEEILRFAGVSDCDMELGSLRCDANISLMRAGATAFGTKVEIKNLNSFKMVQRALEYEERRQAAILAAGGTIAAETRLWQDEKEQTRSMRSKESAPDYRYFPDPDLPPLCIDDELLAAARAGLGELPHARRRRFHDRYGLPDYDIGQLTRTPATGAFFEMVVQAGAEPKTVSNWLMSELLPLAQQRGVAVDALGLAPPRVAELLRTIDAGTITVLAGKQALHHMLANDCDAAAAIGALGLAKITDPTVIEPLALAAIAALPQAATAVTAGNDKAIDALKGHVMRALRGRADAAVVDRILRRHLSPR